MWYHVTIECNREKRKRKGTTGWVTMQKSLANQYSPGHKIHGSRLVKEGRTLFNHCKVFPDWQRTALSSACNRMLYFSNNTRQACSNSLRDNRGIELREGNILQVELAWMARPLPKSPSSPKHPEEEKETNTTSS